METDWLLVRGRRRAGRSSHSAARRPPAASISFQPAAFSRYTALAERFQPVSTDPHSLATTKQIPIPEGFLRITTVLYLTSLLMYLFVFFVWLFFGLSAHSFFVCLFIYLFIYLVVCLFV